MSEMVLSVKAFSESIFDMIPTEKIKVRQQSDGIISLIPYENYREKIELSLRQLHEGKTVQFTMEELDDLENMDTDKALEFMECRRKESGL